MTVNMNPVTGGTVTVTTPGGTFTLEAGSGPHDYSIPVGKSMTVTSSNGQWITITNNGSGFSTAKGNGGGSSGPNLDIQ